MALIQLIASGQMDVPNKRSYDNISLEFNNNICTIDRHGDKCDPEFIVINQPSEDFLLKRIELLIGGSQILSLNCSLLEEIIPNFKQIKDEQIIYKIPLEYLEMKGKIDLIRLAFHDTKIKLVTEGSYQNAKLYGGYHYLDTQERSILAHNPQEYQIKQLLTQYFENSNNINILLNGICNGFLIKGTNLDTINNIQLILNGHERINYNQLELSLFCNKISDSCFYLPLTPNKDFNDNNFQYGLNLSRIETTTLIIDAPNFSGSISIFTRNILRYMSGMACVTFALLNSEFSDISSINNIITWIEEIKSLEGDNICPVNLEEIKLNDKYLKCKTCHKNFLLNITQHYIETKKKCPHCRQKWQGYITYLFN